MSSILAKISTISKSNVRILDIIARNKNCTLKATTNENEEKLFLMQVPINSIKQHGQYIAKFYELMDEPEKCKAVASSKGFLIFDKSTNDYLFNFISSDKEATKSFEATLVIPTFDTSKLVDALEMTKQYFSQQLDILNHKLTRLAKINKVLVQQNKNLSEILNDKLIIKLAEMKESLNHLKGQFLIQI